MHNSLEIPYEQPTSYDLAPFGFPSAFDASTGTESLGSPESGNNSSGDADNSQAAPSSKDLKRKVSMSRFYEADSCQY